MDFSELIAAADPSIFTESIKAWVSGLNINSVIMLIMMIFMIRVLKGDSKFFDWQIAQSRDCFCDFGRKLVNLSLAVHA